MFAPTPFDVLHEHFGNIGASYECKSIKWDPSSCNLQNWKRSKVNKLFNLVLGQKMQKSPQNTQFVYIGVANMKFCSIGLKFGPQVQKEFY